MNHTQKNTAENLTKSEILSILLKKWNPVPASEVIPVSDAYGRILAEDQFAQYDLPVFRASSMDGIAVSSERFTNGVPDTSDWKSGIDFVRADTGDDFDDAFDSVIAIEDVRIDPNSGLTLNLPQSRPLKPGTNVRPAGSNIRKGILAVHAGHSLTPLDLSILVNCGISEIPVIKKPVIGFIPTGSELIPPGVPPRRGQNIDSNSTLALHLIREMGGEPLCYPIVHDKKEELSHAVRRALDECDIVLINGGSSKGEEDYNTQIIEKYGEMICHWVKAAPGRPMGVAIAENKPLINLSGPGIAAFYGMEWCLRPLIARALGIGSLRRHHIGAVLTEDIHAPGAIEFLCMLSLKRDENGILRATPLSNRASGQPALQADGMLITELDVTLYKKGDTISVDLLRPACEF